MNLLQCTCLTPDYRQYFILALVIGELVRLILSLHSLKRCLAFAYIIPIGMIQAITNQQVGLNVITELIIGYALPGRPIAMMMFKTWGYTTMGQGNSHRQILC